MKTVIRKPASHGLHLFLSIITFGCWLPVWAVMAVVGRRETITVPDTAEPAYQNRYPAPYPQPVPPSWSADEPYTQVYGGATYRWNPWTNRWDRTYG